MERALKRIKEWFDAGLITEKVYLGSKQYFEAIAEAGLDQLPYTIIFLPDGTVLLQFIGHAMSVHATFITEEGMRSAEFNEVG